MTMTTDQAVPPAEPVSVVPVRNRPRWQLLLGLVALAWALPELTHLVGADWLLPPLVLLATASLLRSEGGLLDRIMIATGWLIGIGCGAGLLWSVWPWGMRPTPVAGVALTVIAVFAVVTGRRPQLPRARWTDAIPALAALAGTAYMAAPYLRAATFQDRLSITMAGEDNARHMMSFDMIGRIGKYLFMAPDARPDEAFHGMDYYPQGWHLTAALLDGFLPGPAATERAGMAAFDHYTWWTVAGFAFFLLTTIWATLWIGSRRLHPLHQLTAAAVVLVVCLGSDLPRLLASGYAPEVLGLALTGFLMALIARPLTRIREQILLVAALVLGIGFTYYLFLVPAAVAGLLWLIADRRRLLTRPITVIAIALPTIVMALLPSVIGLSYGGQSGAAAIPGPPPPLAGVIAISAAVAAGLFGLGARRTPVSWSYAHVLLVGIAFTVAFAALGAFSGTPTGYYFGKTLHLTLVTAILGAGILVQFLPVPHPRQNGPEGVRGWLAPSAVAGLVCASVLAVTGLAGGGSGLFSQKFANKEVRQSTLADPLTWGQAWYRTRLQRPRQATKVMAAILEFPPAANTPTFIVDDTAPFIGYRETVFMSAIQRTSGTTAPGLYGPTLSTELERLQQLLSRIAGPVRLIVVSAAADDLVEQALATRPQDRSRVTVVGLPGSGVGG